MANLQKKLSEQINFQELSFGDSGFVFVSDADPTTDYMYRVITALTSATLTVTQDQLKTTTEITLPAGASIVGRFSEISSVAGDLICYIG